MLRGTTVLFVALASAAQAQPLCGPRWLPGPGAPGTNGRVFAHVLWDPDGAGPEPEMLVIGGAFTVAGDAAANGIAAWDGQSWRTLGTGMSGSTGGPYGRHVAAFIIHEGQLIAGGGFTSAGGVPARNLARWDGQAWHALGSGTDLPVSALASFNGDVVAAGGFTQAGGAPASRIARWDGGAWHALGAGLSGGSGFAEHLVASLLVHEGSLYAGGLFTSAGGAPAAQIARWDGAAWHTVGGGMAGSGAAAAVIALAEHEGDLIAAGEFDLAGGVPANDVARWDGNAWSAMGEGFAWDQGGVQTLGRFDDELLAGGVFGQSGGTPIRQLARWTGEAWEQVGNGIEASRQDVIAEHGGVLIVAGQFNRPNRDDEQIFNVARLGGDDRWEHFGNGSAGSIASMLVHDGELIVGGAFQLIDGVPLRGIASWDGTGWESLLANAGAPSIGVTALAHYNGVLVAGGLDTADGQSVAYWDGASWRSLGGGFGSLSIADFLVRGGDLIVAGDFNHFLGAAGTNVVRWDGAQWLAMGQGLDTTGPTGIVAAVEEFNGEVIAGGRFTFSGGTPLSHIARFDGAQWRPLGPGMEGAPAGSVPVVSALAVHEGSLVAAGSFTAIGGQPFNQIARWDGSQWHAMGEGFAGGSVVELEVIDGELIAMGGFTASGAAPLRGIARWNGAAWEPYGAGLTGGAFCAARCGPELVVGGNFTGSGATVSVNFARWTGDGAPWVAMHPADAAAAPGGTAVFQAAAASGYPGVVHQWRHGGQALTDGPTGTGSVISGASGPELTVANVSGADEGAYDCVVSSACGSSASLPATLTIACAADVDGDGALTLGDFVAFRNLYVAGDLGADFDGDGVLTLGDFVTFRNAYAAGCG